MTITAAVDHITHFGAGLLGAGIALLLVWPRIAHLPHWTRLAAAIGVAIMLAASCFGLAVIFTKTPTHCVCMYNDPSIFRSGGDHD